MSLYIYKCMWTRDIVQMNSTDSGAPCLHAVSVWSLESLGQRACLLCLEGGGGADERRKKWKEIKRGQLYRTDPKGFDDLIMAESEHNMITLLI